jgi:hypothetical protein
MNFKLIKFLTAICVALCIILFGEWMYAMYTQSQLLEDAEGGDSKKKVIAELPSIELSKRPEASYSDLVTRPLFIQGRKPVNEPDEAPTPTATAATGTFNWALNGIYTHQNKLYALFSRTTAKLPKDNYRKVTKDSDIDGWKVIEINNDKVVVSQGTKELDLPLRKPKPKDEANKNGNPVFAPPGSNQFGQPMAPNQQPIAIPPNVPVPVPEPDPEIEPELIPDESIDSNFENSDDEELQ